MERLKAAGLEVMLATPDEVVSSWAGKTSERWKVRTHFDEALKFTSHWRIN